MLATVRFYTMSFSSILFLFVFLTSCSNTYKTSDAVLDATKTTIEDRFIAPQGYTTIVSKSNSFSEYLEKLRLKPIDAKVKYFDGDEKTNFGVYCSVVDMDIDAQDLQQCADAVMRLRGEYLYEQKRLSDIHFNFVSDGKPRYFKEYANGDYSYIKFRKYMRYIFSYANTASLHDELPTRKWDQMQIGDVFVQKKNPYGHAVIVVNMAKDKDGNKVFMLAQSYMPAQETQILVNPKNAEISPWYKLKEGEVKTPEWTFTTSDLKHF